MIGCSREHPGRWDDRLTALCSWCGRRFPIRDDMPGQQVACPLDACDKPLQLNPFVVDGKVAKQT